MKKAVRSVEPRPGDDPWVAVMANEELVRATATFIWRKTTARMYCQLDDVRSLARMGLYDAAKRWRPAPGSHWAKFATQRIKWAVLDGLRVASPVPRSQHDRGHEPPLSLEGFGWDDGDDRYFERGKEDETLEDVELRIAFSQVWPKLTSKMQMYLGLRMTGMTHAEVGASLGVTESRSSQVVSRAKAIYKREVAA